MDTATKILEREAAERRFLAARDRMFDSTKTRAREAEYLAAGLALVDMGVDPARIVPGELDLLRPLGSLGRWAALRRMFSAEKAADSAPNRADTGRRAARR